MSGTDWKGRFRQKRTEFPGSTCQRINLVPLTQTLAVEHLKFVTDLIQMYVAGKGSFNPMMNPTTHRKVSCAHAFKQNFAFECVCNCQNGPLPPFRRISRHLGPCCSSKNLANRHNLDEQSCTSFSSWLNLQVQFFILRWFSYFPRQVS